MKILTLLKNQSSTLFCVTLFYTMGAPLCLAQEQQFFLDDWQPKKITIPTYITATPPTQAITATVTVDAANTITNIPTSIYGQNAAGWAGQLNLDVSFLQDVSNLNPHIIRWPGGNLSNDYFWNATSAATSPKDLPPNFKLYDLEYGANKNGWTMPTDAYYDMLAKTNSKGIICVNYAYARYSTSADPVAAAAKYAADWVRYDNGRTRYWEIGNENYGNWELGYKIDTQFNKDGQPETISGELYGKHARVFIDAMRQAAKEVGNDIKIGVVAMDDAPKDNSVMGLWNKGLMPQIAEKADFIIIHSYYTPWNENSTVATILNTPVAKTKILKDGVENDLKLYGNNHAPLPVALTEWGIFAEGSHQSASYINGIHAALILGETIKNKYGQASRWAFLNGDIGLFESKAPNVTERSPSPSFFYMYYFQKMFGDKMVNAAVSGNSDIVSYASTFTSGQSGIVIVNKGKSEQTVDVKMNNFAMGSRYYYYVLTGGTDNGDFSRKVYVNGQTTTEDAGGPNNYATLNPYSASMNGGIKITVPKTGVVYLLVDKTTNTTSSRATSSTPILNWTPCANENQTCTFSGTKRVRYGANTSWKKGIYTNSVACNNTTFGDPIVGTGKSCQFADYTGNASSKANSSIAPSSKASSRATSSIAVKNTNCEYTVANEWNSGFTGTIRITNKSTNPITGWNVSWAYNDGTTITSSWNANVTGTNPYTATGVSWNSTIQPGQFIEFGVQGTKGSNSTAQIPVISGSLCH